MSKLQLAVDTYKRLVEKNIVSRRITGVLPEEGFLEVKKQLEDYGLFLSSQDEKFQIEFELPSEDNELFALDMNDLLQAPSRLHRPPAAFYLAKEDCLFQNGSAEPANEEVKTYIDTALFASVLLELADHKVLTGKPKAIFLHGEKLELSIVYGSKDLKDLAGLREFISEFVQAEIHKDQKATIIKSVLLEMLKNNEIDKLTLPCLIKRFSEFLERVNANYQLYVSEFSFEKIKAQVESEKFEFTLKLNKVFSEIQNQLLAVPVALILVGSQMKQAANFTLMNTSIWCGAIVFGIFMSILIRNQRNTLKAIKLEMDSQWIAIEGKHKYVAERLQSHYNQLQNRYFMQHWFLIIVSAIIAGSILISTALFIYKSQALDVYKEIILNGLYGGLFYLLACLLWKFFPKIKGKINSDNSV